MLYVAQIENVERDDPSKNPQLLEEARQSLNSMLADDMLATVQNAARQNARVQFNQLLIDRLVGKSNGAEDDAK